MRVNFKKILHEVKYLSPFEKLSILILIVSMLIVYFKGFLQVRTNDIQSLFNFIMLATIWFVIAINWASLRAVLTRPWGSYSELATRSKKNYRRTRAIFYAISTQIILFIPLNKISTYYDVLWMFQFIIMIVLIMYFMIPLDYKFKVVRFGKTFRYCFFTSLMFTLIKILSYRYKLNITNYMIAHNYNIDYGLIKLLLTIVISSIVLLVDVLIFRSI